MQQIQQENKKWAPVDKEDAQHMKRAAQRAKQKAEKNAKIKEKQLLI